MIVAVVPAKDEPDLPGFLQVVGRYVHRSVTAEGGSLGDDLRKGLRVALTMGADRVVVIDAGWSHDPAQIPHLLAKHHDVVIGSRFCPGGHHDGTRSRRWGSRLYGLACLLTTGCGIRDWTSGYRVYSRRAVEAILAAETTAQRHAVQVEFLRAAISAGCSVTEVPIRYRVMPGSTFSRTAAREAVRVLFAVR